MVATRTLLLVLVVVCLSISPQVEAWNPFVSMNIIEQVCSRRKVLLFSYLLVILFCLFQKKIIGGIKDRARHFYNEVKKGLTGIVLFIYI